MYAIDLFAGAGGMSLGAQSAGYSVIQAVEIDPHACKTYQYNFPDTDTLNADIEQFKSRRLPRYDSVVFGGPPCQGFSTSNQRSRNTTNQSNWLFRRFFKIIQQAKPEWIVFENVKGIIETASGLFFELVLKGFDEMGYSVSFRVLNASDYGVPQSRHRVFVIGNRYGKVINFEGEKKSKIRPITVMEALHDLPDVGNGATDSWLKYKSTPLSVYAKGIRNGATGCANNITTKNSDLVLERYKYVPQGGNWVNIPAALMSNYKDRTRCHSGIYHRLLPDMPSIVLGNFRKNMLIHPFQCRGLSVREAARLQSFPDWFEFMGSIGYQQQQVGNAVPPKLAQFVFELLNG